MSNARKSNTKPQEIITMLVGLKCNQELLQQLIAVQAVLRSPTKSDALRRLIQDAYEKFFADKLTNVNKQQ